MELEKSEAEFKNKEDDIKEALTEDDDLEPKTKLAKLIDNTISLNAIYENAEFKQLLSTNWLKCDNLHDFEHSSGLKFFRDPFQICMLPNFLQNEIHCKHLVSEMVNEVEWSRKMLDLYEFYQADINCQNEWLENFKSLLKTRVLPWLEEVTHLELGEISISCSMYTVGDHLLVHDDLLADREIAFVYYLSPWEGLQEWPEHYGGCLELFDSDNEGLPHFPVKRKISPRNNQFVFFKVGSKSFHQVGEVTNYNYPRLTINGWFHRRSKDYVNESLEGKVPSLDLDFQQPNVSKKNVAAKLVQEFYLDYETRKQIQQSIENNSEISLSEYFQTEIFEAAQKQLLEDESLVWKLKHPANLHYYEVLDISTASSALAELIKFFTSTEFFDLLYDYTDLDLGGREAIVPTCAIEIQRWTPGNYTVIGDGSLLDVNTLDLIYYLNADDSGAVVTYLSPEDDPSEEDAVLLTVTPADNTLNMVYRCEGTTKFVKYISKNSAMLKGPVFVISCSYKE